MVRFIQSDLVVPRKGVHETQQLVTGRRVYKEVNAREQVTVLRAGLV